MKTKRSFLIYLILSVFLLFGTGCAVIQPQHHSRAKVHFHAKGRIPPGHQKKFTGAKSTKHYSPGYNKKHQSPVKKNKRK